MNHCVTCKKWTPFPATNGRGGCKAVADEDDVREALSNGEPSPRLIAKADWGYEECNAWLETDAYFGCTEWEGK